MSGHAPMGTVKIQIPLVTWRDGRPRFFASTAQRKLGLKGQDLRHEDTGQWFDVTECIAWSKTKLIEIADLRTRSQVQSIRTVRRHAAKPSEVLSLSHIVEDFLSNDPRNLGREIIEGKRKRKGRAEKTVKFYKFCATALETHAPDDWSSPVANCTVKKISDLLHKIEVAAGLSTVRGVRSMLSQAFEFAVSKKLMRFNPVKLLTETLPVPAPRVRVASLAEIQALEVAADRILNRPDVADLIIAGVLHGQNATDRITLKPQAVSSNTIDWTRSKTKAAVTLPIPQWLARRMQNTSERRKTLTVQPLLVFIDEKKQRRFLGDWYSKMFAKTRKAAIKGDPLQNIEPCTSLEGFNDQDLRDTCLTWLKRAGCTNDQVGSVSGHAFAKKEGVLRHYLEEHDPEAAKLAIAKLETWLNDQTKTQQSGT